MTKISDRTLNGLLEMIRDTFPDCKIEYDVDVDSKNFYVIGSMIPKIVVWKEHRISIFEPVKDL